MMKKFLMFAWLLFLTLSARAETGLEKESTNAPHRKIYAFFQSNFDWMRGEYGLGSFYADSPHETEQWMSFLGQDGFYTGAAANGVYYGLSYLYVDGAPPVAQDLIAVEMKTGEKRAIGPWAEDPNMKVQDMTYNYGDSTMYAISYGYENVENEDGTYGSYLASVLYSIDLQTGKMTKRTILDTAMGYGAIAAGYEGSLYLMGNDGKLYTADKTSGAVTLLCETEYKRPAHFWGMEVDHTDGSLYWVVMSYDYDQGAAYHLIRFDLKTDPVTYENLGTIGSPQSEALLYGLYIPFVLAGEEAPSSPTGISVVPDPTGALKAGLKWTNPETTFGGKKLENLSSIRILRNGEPVADIPAATPGQVMEWTDENVPEPGFHEYILKAVNSTGEGENAYVNRYIGPDFPAKITGLEVTKTDGCRELRLSWEKSQGGENGSYVDSTQVSYKIIRYPDSVVLAENIKTTEFTDNKIERLYGYSYGIFAVNEIGETVVVSDVHVAGPPMEPDGYFTMFSTADTMLNQWTRSDDNRDNWTWACCTLFGYYQFGEFYPAAEYYTNPTLNPPGSLQDADDYLLSPPFLFKSGMKYRLSFDYRCVTDEKLEITTGKINTSDSQSPVETIDLLPSDPFVEFGYVEVAIPASMEENVRVIGLHIVSPLRDDYYSFLQLTNLKIEEAGTIASESTEVLSDVQVGFSQNRIRIEGSFDYADIFSVTGQHLFRSGQADIPTDTLTQGLYLVRVVKGREIRTFKVAVL